MEFPVFDTTPNELKAELNVGLALPTGSEILNLVLKMKFFYRPTWMLELEKPGLDKQVRQGYVHLL